MVKLSSIKPNPNNPRLIKDDRFVKLVKSIQEFPKMMELRPMVIDKTRIIIGGNMRLKALRELGYKEIPNEWIKKAEDLTEEERRRFIIADNVSFGENDWEALGADWDIKELEEWGLDINGFAKPDESLEEDDFENNEEIETDIVQGDLFEIGPHRLLCGDSTQIIDIENVTCGQIPELVFADPPYGVDIVQGSSVGGGGPTKFGGKIGKTVKSTKGFNRVIGDKTTDAAKRFYNACKKLAFNNLIIWGGNYFTDFLPPSMCWIVWYKKNTGNFADFEMAWTSFNQAAKLYEYLWNGLSREGERRLELKRRAHPTQKAVGVCGMIFNDFQFELCFDGFGGSGTTMVACHEMKRRCAMIEIDPKYCQIIVDRMRNLDPSIIIKKNGVFLENAGKNPDQAGK